MEIELVTTNKKLTRTIIDQMLVATHEDLAMMMLYPERVLGYVVIKGEKLAIIKGVDDWKKYPIDRNWKAANHSPTECVSKNRFLRLESVEMRTLFLERYAKLLEVATVHIYI